MFWKKCGYNHHVFSENKHIFCNGINISYCTLIKPDLKYGPYHVNRFVKKLMLISNLLVRILRKIRKSSVLEIEKMCFSSICQPPWSTILEKVSHVGKLFFTITLQQIVMLSQIFKKTYLLFNCYLIGLFIVSYKE